MIKKKHYYPKDFYYVYYSTQSGNPITLRHGQPFDVAYLKNESLGNGAYRFVLIAEPTIINENAFSTGEEQLVSFIIPKSIIEIKSEAFYDQGLLDGNPTGMNYEGSSSDWANITLGGSWWAGDTVPSTGQRPVYCQEDGVTIYV